MGKYNRVDLELTHNLRLLRRVLLLVPYTLVTVMSLWTFLAKNPLPVAALCETGSRETPSAAARCGQGSPKLL